MPTEPRLITLSQIVRRASEVVDPADADALVGDFELRFEDADEPVTAIDDLDGRLATVLADLDPGVQSGSLSMAAAITTYLSYRRDELHAKPEELMKLAARAEWEGRPPSVVEDWLGERGVRL
jgi:hypothetical protein